MTDPGTSCQGQDYYGIGHVAIKGSAGRVVGEAILYRTTDGGDSWSLDFTRVDAAPSDRASYGRAAAAADLFEPP